MALARLQLDPEKCVEMLQELQAEREQNRETRKVEQYLQVLDPRSVARLSSRFRPMIREMGLPLRKDIDNFTIGAANDNRPLAFFNAARVAAVDSKSVEEDATVVECRIRSYDRDASLGKVVSDEFTRKLNFVVPAERRLELQPKILAAMQDHIDTVTLEVLRVVDRSEEPTSLILMDILPS